MTNSTALRVLALMCLTLLMPLCGYAQNPPQMVNDQVIGGTGGKFEFIDMSNGGVNLEIPIYRIKGRGYDDFLTANYTSKNFYTTGGGTLHYWQYNPPWSSGMPGGGLGNTSSAIIDYCTWHPGSPNPPIQEPITAYFNGIAYLPDGSTKAFPWLEIDYVHCDTPPTFANYKNTYATDLSGAATDSDLVFADGTRPVKDSNGNFESSTQDSAGRNLPTVTWSPDGSTATITLIDGRQIVFHYASVTVSTAFVNPPTATNFSGSMTNMLTQIDLPNGTSWKFQYAPNSYGQLTKVILPTGGYIRYTYAVQSKFAFNPTWGFKGGHLEDSLCVTGRYVSADGVTEAGETYSYAVASGTTVTQRIVTKLTPVGDQEIHIFKPMTSDLQFKETDAQYYKGTAKVLRETQNSWTCDTIPASVYTTPPSGQGPGQAPGSAHVGLGGGNCRVLTKTTMLFDGPSALTKTERYQYDANLSDSYPSSAYFNITYAPYTTTFGNVIQTLESDWGTGGTPGTPTGPGTPGTAGPLLRETDVTYLTTNPQNGNIDYRSPGIHIVDRPILMVVKDGNGNVLSQTSYQYDGSALTDTSGTPAPNHDYTHFPKTNLTRGNLTQTRRWLSTTNTWLSTNMAYDDLGNLRSETDPNLNTTSFSYADNFSDGVNRSSQAYLTQITRPTTNGVNHISNNSYYYPTALLYQAKDENQQLTTYSYDNMNRVSSETFPDGGAVVRNHQDVAPLGVTSTTKVTGTLNRVSTTLLDGLSRTTQTQLNSDPDGVTYVDMTYDPMGRTASVSNPYRSKSDSTYGVTTYVYDSLGRVCVVVPPDGTSVPGSTCPATRPANDVFTIYAGNTTTVTDQAAQSRKSVTDGLGRLTQVFEDPSGFNYETDYTSDPLGNLVAVNQKGGSTNSANWRTRTFTYDSLSRPVCASNPENSSAACPATATSGYTTGTIGYAYDANSNLLAKTALAPNQTGTATVITSYSYDALNRLTQKSYNDTPRTPSIQYGYDAVALAGCATTPPTLTDAYPVGRTTAMCDGAGAESWSHNTMGRILTDSRTTNSLTKSTTYAYLPYVDGSVNSITYPSGRTITYNTGGAERLLWAQDNSTSVFYASSALYAPPGGLSFLTNGSDLYSTHLYNNRLQPCWIYTTTGTALSTTTACTGTAATGNILDLKYNYSLGSSDNGDVMGITNNRDNTRSQTFAYDSLNRLTLAETTSTHATSPANCWGETYLFDNLTTAGGAWGNLTTIAAPSSAYTGCVQESLSVTTLPNNQLSSFGYDSPGNLNSGSGVSGMSYNAENKLVTAAGDTYLYDGRGHRVAKSVSGSINRIYWYDPAGKVLEETDGSGSVANAAFNEYVFFGGQRIARRDSSNNVFYYFSDHLGTSRTIAEVAFGQSTATLCYDADFYPFGGERGPIVSNCSQNYKFTGKERDTESGLDYFGSRFYASNLARFSSTDPILGTVSHLVDPQRWNEYSYVSNNPLNRLDQSGGYWMPWEHNEITTWAYARAGVPINPAAIAADVNRDGGGINPTASFFLHHSTWTEEQYSPGTQANHFLRDKSETQGQAYNHAIDRLQMDAEYALSEYRAGNRGASDEFLGDAFHLIQDSYAHTDRIGGTGAITHIQCFNCAGADDDHHHPPYRTGDEQHLSPQAEAAMEASEAFIILFLRHANRTIRDPFDDLEFQVELSQFEEKYLAKSETLQPKAPKTQ